MVSRTFNTLFILSSLDGKISTGKTDKRDFDKDLPKIKGVKEGLYQYYNIEKTTDLCSLNTGRVLAKIGINKSQRKINKIPASFVVIDSKPHLTNVGVQNLLRKCKKVYLITSNKSHPAFRFRNNDLKVIFYKKKIDFSHLFRSLKQKYGIKSITVQSGGNLNSVLLRQRLIDRVSIVIAPALIGGKDTPTVMDGKSLSSTTELRRVRNLKLVKVEKLSNSFLHLIYDVK